MKLLLLGVLAAGAFAENAVHSAGHVHGSIRSVDRGHRRNAYGRGYGGFYYGDLAPSYDTGYASAPAPSSPAPMVVYPAAIPAPAVHPVIHEYAQPQDQQPAPEASQGPVLYLIAFHDGAIRAAMTYWVENGTLHYLDRDHKQKQAPLTSVDRDLSAQLNRERRVPFNLQ